MLLLCYILYLNCKVQHNVECFTIMAGFHVAKYCIDGINHTSHIAFLHEIVVIVVARIRIAFVTTTGPIIIQTRARSDLDLKATIPVATARSASSLNVIYVLESCLLFNRGNRRDLFSSLMS